MSNDDCLKDKREDYQNCSVPFWVQQLHTIDCCFRFSLAFCMFFFSVLTKTIFFVLSAFVVLGLVCSVLCQQTGWKERLHNDLLCVNWDVCMHVCIIRARVQPTLDPYAEAFIYTPTRGLKHRLQSYNITYHTSSFLCKTNPTYTVHQVQLSDRSAVTATQFMFNIIIHSPSVLLMQRLTTRSCWCHLSQRLSENCQRSNRLMHGLPRTCSYHCITSVSGQKTCRTNPPISFNLESTNWLTKIDQPKVLTASLCITQRTFTGCW